MPLTFQVVIDSHRPHELADWWAETLGWDVEPQDEAFIRSMVEQGFATDADTMRHRDALVWREGAAINPPEGGPRVLFQLTEHDKVGKNRVHLDLRDVPDDRTELYARLVERGARELWRASQGPHSWVTFADPEGNEFCA